MYAQCNICSFTALDEKQWNEHTSSTRHKLNDFIYYEGVKAGQYQADAKLRQALTEANALYNTVEAINLDLTERIEYANAGDLVTIPRELVLAMEAKRKEQTALLKDARIALTFFRNWMADADGTRYPFGREVEDKIIEATK